MDRLTEINAFVKVVQMGSFAEAARQLHVSSTIVSRHVRELEGWLGVRLLNRTTRHVSLTEIGHIVHERAAAVLTQLQVLEETAGNWRGVARGTLRVSAPLGLGSTVFAKQLPEFLARYPNINVDLTLTDRYVDIVEEGFDVAIAVGDLPDSTAMVRTLCHVHSGIYASPIYLHKHGYPRSAEDLLNHECILHTPFGEAWTIIEQKNNKTHTLKIKGQLRTNSTLVGIAGIIQGQGIGLAPNYFVRDALSAGTVERLLPDCAPPPILVRAIYHPGQYQAAKLPVFMDFLISIFENFS